MFKDGSAYLKISPNSEGMTGTSSNVSGFDMGSSSSNSTPWPLSAQRSDCSLVVKPLSRDLVACGLAAFSLSRAVVDPVCLAQSPRAYS